MASNLQPLQHPLKIYPNFTASRPETFLAKGRDGWSDRASYIITFATPLGEPGTPFLEIKEETRKEITFHTMDGQEVMKIVKQKHIWSGKGTEYHGMRGGREVWHLKLHQGWKGTDYQLTLHESSITARAVSVQNKVQDQEKGILIDNIPVATMSRHEQWSHVHRHDLIHVAPGMDILLALGVNWIRVDKQNQDAKTAVAAAT